MAYTAKNAQATSCPFGKVERYNSQGQPAKTARYWKIAPWMAMMLADPDIGPDMIKKNEDAPADAEKARTVFKDLYHSDIYRDLVKKGIIKSPMDIFVSLGADGYEAWIKSGYQGWPIMLTI